MFDPPCTPGSRNPRLDRAELSVPSPFLIGQIALATTVMHPSKGRMTTRSCHRAFGTDTQNGRGGGQDVQIAHGPADQLEKAGDRAEDADRSIIELQNLEFAQ